jgi:phage repressor protein C with HTH and peptisase S24 domain
MIPVTTKWNRDELEIVSSTGSHAYTQRLTMHDGRLVVVTSINRDDEPPVTYTYKRR